MRSGAPGSTPDTWRALPPARSHSAQNLKAARTVTVYYRWHPHFGLTLRVLRQQRYGLCVCFVCEAPSGISCSLPSWMCDPECFTLTLGERLISVDALIELRHLLDNLHVPSACDTASQISPKEGIDEADHQEVLPAPAVKSATSRPGRKLGRSSQQAKRTESGSDGVTAPRSARRVSSVRQRRQG